jgi:hypothetical protein
LAAEGVQLLITRRLGTGRRKHLLSGLHQVLNLVVAFLRLAKAILKQVISSSSSLQDDRTLPATAPLRGMRCMQIIRPAGSYFPS